MAADHQFFYEDEVFRVNKNGKIMFGMVVENFKLYSSDDSSSSSDDEEPKVEEGHIRVAWHPHGKKEVISEKKVGLANRSLMPGDVVRRLSRGEHSMKGYCRNIHVSACVQIKGTNKIIENVDSKSLIPFEKLSSGTSIVMDSWVGGVQLVHIRLTLFLRDGSKCYLSDPESYCFLSCNEQNDKFAENYYPGQCLRGPIKYLDTAEWIHCTKRTKALLANKSAKKIKVYVEAVDTVSALVDWKCQICCKDGDTSGKPLHTMIMGEDFKKLRLLNYFKACTLQVGDRNMYRLKDSDQLLTVSEWKKGLKEKLSVIGRNLPNSSDELNRLARKRSYCNSQADEQPTPAEKTGSGEMDISGVASSNENSDDNSLLDSNVKRSDKSSWMQNLLGIAKPTIDEVYSLIHLSQKKVCGHFNKTNSVDELGSKNPPQTMDDESIVSGNLSAIENKARLESTASNENNSNFLDSLKVRDLPKITENAAVKCSEVFKSTMNTTLNALNNSDWQEFNVKGKNPEETGPNINSFEEFPPLEASKKTDDDVNDTCKEPYELSESYDSECDEDYSDEEEEDAESVCGDGPSSLSSTCSSTTSNKSSNQRQGKSVVKLMAKVLKKKKLKGARKKKPNLNVQPGDMLVVETVRTFSAADVVWQDGSIELGIPSTELYPIHHLDDQEFFPGDFVIENRTEDTELLERVGPEKYNRLYGVIQSVDHIGRTAKLKWFLTYVSPSDPVPSLVQENEMSVYDLKDHPDFQFRPGDVVVRLGNVDNEHQNATAGQILDIYPEGQVYVWWAEGFKTMSWPQDLYKLNDTDSDDSEIWDHSGSEGVWETDSEEVVYTPSSPVVDNNFLVKIKLANNIEMARGTLKRLEKMIRDSPELLTSENIKKFYGVYRDCRSLDKYLGTSFFRDKRFYTLIFEVKELERTGEQKKSDAKVANDQNSGSEIKQSSLHSVKRLNLLKSSSLNSCNEETETVVSPELDKSDEWSSPAAKKSSRSLSTVTGEFLSANLASLEMEFFNNSVVNAAKSDSALSSSIEDTQMDSCQNSSAEQPVDQPKKVIAATGGWKTTCHPCVELCQLILEQLLKAEAEVYKLLNHPSCKSLQEELTGVKNADEMIDDIHKYTQINSFASEKLTPIEGPIPDSPESPDPETADVRFADGSIIYRSKSLLDLLAETQKSQTIVVYENDTSADSGVDAEFELPASVSKVLLQKEGEGFSMLSAVPECHKYESSKYVLPHVTNPRNFMKTVNNEIKLLLTSLPCGITVKGFEGRMDLYSAMIEGPENTPYEDGLFFFDIQLPSDYPDQPPLCHYTSYCSDRLNPNLYEDGKVCVSLLGTWSGRGTEMWTSSSNLLQVLVSIQGLILVSEPYFNEAGYENQKGTQQGHSNSQLYNEMVVLKLVQAMTKLLIHPPSTFQQEIMKHFTARAEKLITRLENWLFISENHSAYISGLIDLQEKQNRLKKLGAIKLPEYPLLPASKGFCLSLRKALNSFKDTLKSVGIVFSQEPVFTSNSQLGSDKSGSSSVGEPQSNRILESKIGENLEKSRNSEDSVQKIESDENLVNRVSNIQVRKVDRSKSCVEKVKSLSKIDENFKSGQNNICSLKSSSSKS
ncbi:unnamed protein product [Bemisia tabaci]|uniref:UBC core domain-containing protein n=1 Tax=Bemisia tabaci TaxID=7038 RepID=A0A9P0AP76_BEMTA|nr:unnamed protein product [Bemisia tabaci]